MNAPALPGALPRVLSIAGTDPSGGAGTAADTKSIIAAGGYAMTVVTSVVAQNTRGVRLIHTPPVEVLRAQLDAVADDVSVDAVKTGMLGTVQVIETTAAWLAAHRPPVLVIDPVMVASSGDRLLEPDAEEAMRAYCETGTVITPNIPELAVLVGAEPARDAGEALTQARSWADRTGVAVVVKTGHLTGRSTSNLWVGPATPDAPDGVTLEVPSVRVDTRSTHGTGCSLSSALATRLGGGQTPGDALAWATSWLHEAIAHGEELHVGTGEGHGPVDHGHRARRLQAAGSSAPWPEASAVPEALHTPEELDAPEPSAAEGRPNVAGRSDAVGRSDALGRSEAVGRPVTLARPETVGHPAGPHAGSARSPLTPRRPEPLVPAAGPWTAALWRAGAGLAGEVSGSDFVSALVQGTLDQADFAFYLAQDAQYLQTYARALAGLATSATDPAESAYWAEAARIAVVVESGLHRDWLAGHVAHAQDGPLAGRMSPVTAAYTDFLLARVLADEHVVGVAAVLPCYWLYAQVGELLTDVAPGHPYRAWLDTYRDPAFVDSVRTALGHVERALADAGPASRARATRAYLTACRHELEFFEQALRREDGLR